jgi:hypothetical protein
VPADHIPQVLSFVKQQGRSCEQSFSYWLLFALFSEGEGQWALDYMRKHWGDQMKRESFNGAWHEMWETWGTTSHSWCSGPTALLPEKVLGVEPLAPGWKEFRIRPSLCDLDWAEGVVPSVAGNILVKLKLIRKGEEGSGLEIWAAIPEQTRAKIHVPFQSADDFSIAVNNKLIWQDGVSTASDKRISYDSISDDYMVFEFQAGSYTIVAY